MIKPIMTSKIARTVCVCIAAGLSSLSSAVQLDVLVTYDNKAAASNGGNAPSAAARSYVDTANIIYENSGVDIQLNMVGVEFVDMVNHVNTTSYDGYLSASRNESFQLRDDKLADVVVMLTELDGMTDRFGNTGFTGWGYITNAGFFTYSLLDLDASGYVMAHEIGHNLGLNHSRRQGDTGGVANNYGLGHAVDGVFATVMAYVQGGETKYSLFSSPDLSCGGLPCGVPASQPNAAHAVRALNEIALNASAYRFTPSRQWDWNGVEEPAEYNDVSVERDDPNATDFYLRLYLDSANSDPYVRLLNADINADRDKLIKISAVNRTPGTNWEVRFKPAGGAETNNSVPFTMPTNRFLDLVVDMSQDSDWKGQIESITIAPQGNVSGEVEFDYVYMVEGTEVDEPTQPLGACDFVDGATYAFRNVNSDRYMDVAGLSKENGANIQQWGTSAPYGQRRFIASDEDRGRWWGLQNVNSGKFLDIENRSGDVGANLQQYGTNANGSHRQFWSEPVAGGCMLKVRRSQLCLTVEGGSTSNGANISQQVCNGSPSQTWVLEAI